MPSPIQLPLICEAERTPLIDQLVAQLEQLAQENLRQAEIIQQLRNEIAVLKGEKAKPTFKPSGMEEDTDPDAKAPQGVAEGDPPPKRPGSAKRGKTQDLTIHPACVIGPMQPLPPGSRFKGYRDVVVQDIRIKPFNTRYRLEVWQTSEGEWRCGEAPAHLQGGHVDPTPRAFVLYQHHHCQVTQPLLHEPLGEWGIDLSVGQINALLSGHNEIFFAEKDPIVVMGLAVSRSITVDDSGARHTGKNGYVTQLGNEWFAWFSSTYSKSRINFLELLQAVGASATTSMSRPSPIGANRDCPRSRYGIFTPSRPTGSPIRTAGCSLWTPWGSPSNVIAASPPKGRCGVG